MKTTAPTSRLAPSPTGALHLGNARTFLVNWALARGRGWRLLMRMEDLDGPRVRPDAAGRTLEIIDWLGLDFDGTCTTQSQDLDPYRGAMRVLGEAGLVYACALTRAQVACAASAPHGDDQEIRFPATLRPAEADRVRFRREDMNYRLVVEDETIAFTDEFAGPRSHHPAEETGDFVVWTRRGAPAYQLAVVVDDARQGVTDVVRGDDLLPSTARQLLLYRALGHPAPRWWHLPLVVGPDGRRLAKRHGDTRLETYRDRGVAPQRIVGLLASWSGAGTGRVEMSAEEFLDRFDIDEMPRDPIIFGEEDERWLTDGR